jgi:hypothetical protein
MFRSLFLIAQFLNKGLPEDKASRTVSPGDVVRQV